MLIVDDEQIVRGNPWPKPDLAQLVDRKDEVKQFVDTLDNIAHRRPVLRNLFEWYGGPGIGKTQLIRLLKQECSQKEIPWAKIDFSLDANTRYLHDPTVIIEEIATNLKKTISTVSSDIEHDFNMLYERIQTYRHGTPPVNPIVVYQNLNYSERIYERPGWVDNLREVVIQFIQTLSQINQIQEVAKTEIQVVTPISIFFDETERARLDLTDWLEEWLISPLSQLKSVVIVWTARRPWRWKRPEIRRKMQSNELSVFDQYSIQDQIRVQLRSKNLSLAEQLFQGVLTTTGGHPFANAVVISQVDNWLTKSDTITDQFFVDNKKNLFIDLFNTFVSKYALDGLSEKIKRAVELLSLVRMFDTLMLRIVLSDCGGEIYNGWSLEDFSDLLLQLKRTQLLGWEQGYTIEPSLRHIMRDYFFTCEPTVFKAVNQSALDVYQYLLAKPIDNRNVFVIEELYHFASLYQAGEAFDLQTKLGERLQQYLEQIEDTGLLVDTLHQLAGNLRDDQELDEITNGLSKDVLLAQVEEFSQTLQPAIRTDIA